MGSLDLTLGCLLIASWVNLSLFTLEGAQIVRYFTRYPRDSWFNKGSVLAALIADVVTTVAVNASCYLYMISYWGDETYIQSQPLGIPMYILGTTVSAMVVQVWLGRMIYNLTKQWWWLPAIGFFILGGTVGGCATAAKILNHSKYSGRGALVRYVTIWLVATAVADCVITGVLVWKVRTIKTSFTDTKTLLRRLTIAALRNGSITTVMTLITVVVFQSNPEVNTATMIEMTIGRVYTLSMLSNLNNRALLRGGDSAPSGSASVRRTGYGQGHGNGGSRLNPDQTPTVLRTCIRQEVETHYQSDACADAIAISDDTEFRLKRDLESGEGDGDGNSDVGVTLPVVVTVRQEKRFDY